MEDGTVTPISVQASQRPNGVGALEGSPLDTEGRFEMIARQILSLTDALALADEELYGFRQVVEESLEQCEARSGSNGSQPDGEAARSLHRVMRSVEAVTDRFDGVSRAALLVSTQSLTRLSQELQRAAAKLR